MVFLFVDLREPLRAFVGKNSCLDRRRRLAVLKAELDVVLGDRHPTPESERAAGDF